MSDDSIGSFASMIWFLRGGPGAWFVLDSLFLLLVQELFEKKLNLNTPRARSPETRPLPLPPAEDDEQDVPHDGADYSAEDAGSPKHRPTYLAERLQPSSTPGSSSDDGK